MQPTVLVLNGYNVQGRSMAVIASQPGFAIVNKGSKYVVQLEDFLVDPRTLKSGAVVTLADRLEDGWSLLLGGQEIARGDWE
jgi:hypothetical protein